jgi:putative Holliday junction resolvase
MQRILGIDYGRARIGLAISDELGLLAHPLTTIAMGKDAIPRIAEIIQEKKIGTVVVGVPKLMSGAHGTAADEVKLFIKKLEPVATCPIVCWDERLTTVAAQRALREAGKSTRTSRSYVDQVAAQMILQGFLDRQAQRELEQEQQQSV